MSCARTPATRNYKVDVRRGEVLDDDYAAAVVAVRTTTPLVDVDPDIVDRSFGEYYSASLLV